VDEYRTTAATYTPTDFVLWKENGMLVISPKFQRRAVWRLPARSFFIDTMLRGMTVPPLYFRLAPGDSKMGVVREVIDGQQRIRSVLEFIDPDEGYRLFKNLNAPWAGKRFSQLSKNEHDRIMKFEFKSEIFQGISDRRVLEVFCRLNMNGVPLNKQELRNGRFFGSFKQTSYDLAFDYLEFWKQHKIFSDQNIARMLEVELTSELLIAGNDGMQDKKKTIDDFYKKWEESYPSQKRDEKRFNETLGTISETLKEGELAGTEFRRAPLFYTLYCVVYHHLFGLPDVQRASPRKKLTADQREALRSAVVSLSEMVAQSKEKVADVPPKYAPFVVACLRQTDNLGPRKTRFNTLFGEAF
jgi:Protein of unknown function DUF262